MVILSGADLILPDRIVSPGSLILEEQQIVEIRTGATAASEGAVHFDLAGHCVAPGFIDVHVHGLEGRDALDGDDAVGWMAARLPRYGVTAFCPTSVACTPKLLRQLLNAVKHARAAQIPGSARVLPAHLESNFINPEFLGAQPAHCIRTPPGLGTQHPVPPAQHPGLRTSPAGSITQDPAPSTQDATLDSILFTGASILAEIERAAPDVGIVTLAPEIPGGLGLVKTFAESGVRVSLGHSGATFEQAREAIDRGARQATHLFNRMSPLHHRDPGLVGAVLQSEDVAAEIICDGHHVHPAVIRLALGAKDPTRMMAITDATAAAALAVGSFATLGGRRIRVGDTAAYLDNGMLAGSIVTMDRVFRVLVSAVGLSLPDAVTLCCTTPARELGLHGLGVIAPGALADLVVLDSTLSVRQTYIAGTLVYAAN